MKQYKIYNIQLISLLIRKILNVKLEKKIYYNVLIDGII